MLAKIYNKTKNSLRTADRLTLILALIVVIGVITLLPVHAEEGDDVDTNLGGIEVSISYFSGVISDAFNNMVSSSLSTKDATKLLFENIDNIDNRKINISVSNIGNFLGIKAINDTGDNKADVWSYGDTAQVKRLTVDTLWSWHGGSADGMTNSAMLGYMMWGSALSELGIDEFRDAKSASDGIRMITGYGTYICFILAYSASSIMQAVITLLQKLNIFMLLYKSGDALVTDIMYSSALRDTELMKTNILPVYNALKGMRWAVFAIMLVLFVGSITVFKSKAMGQAATTQTRARNLLYRFIIMAIGLPLCGMVYTTCLDLIGNRIEVTQYEITDYIYSEFMDYEAWTVKNPISAFKMSSSHLGSNITVVYDDTKQNMVIYQGDGSEEEPLDASRFVYAINESIYGSEVTGKSETGNYVSDIFKTSEGAGAADSGKTYAQLVEDVEVTSVENREASYQTARDLILAYAKSNTVNGDILNSHYLKDFDTLSEALASASSAETKEQAPINMNAIKQIFGVNSADQRIWAFVGIDDDGWIYGAQNDKTIKLTENDGTKVTIDLAGAPALPNSNGNSYIKVNGTQVMTNTLAVTTVSRNTSSHVPPGILDGLNNMADSQKIKTAITIEDSDFTDMVGNIYTITYDLGTGGMTPLSLYNYMHTKFDKGTIDVYSPTETSNEGISLMHYAVTTPYSGIPEMVQLLYTICMLFSIGVIGWVFGISLLMNTIVQTVKALPLIFKMLMGSIQGFVEALLTVFAICIELLVTILLYSWSINLIDFIIALVKTIVKGILDFFAAVDVETVSMLNGIISMAVVLWGTFELIKWRRAITMSLKSLMTHVLNQLFGTSAAMPTGASSGMLKMAAGAAAAGFAAHSLAEDGTLDDVVNDLTGSDLGSSVGDKLQEGDLSGALSDVKDYANGDYRGRSETADAEKALGEDDIEIPPQQMTDEQQAELDAMDEEIAQAEKEGRIGDAEKLRGEKEEKRQLFAIANGMAGMGKTNTTGGDIEAEEVEDAAPPVEIEPANIPQKPSKTLDADGQSAYTAALEGDGETLRTMGQKYDANGMKASQVEELNQMVADGADETEIAAAVDNFQQENFGDQASEVIAKMNEASGRSGQSVTYGSTDTTNGEPRTVDVQVQRNSNGTMLNYQVTDNNSDAGTQTIEVQQAGGAASYINQTSGATIQTMDMGQAGPNTAGYATVYNSTAQMVRASGGTVMGGAGGTNQVTVSEMSSQISLQQMSNQGVNTGYAGYGNTSANVVNSEITVLQQGGYAPQVQQYNSNPGNSDQTSMLKTMMVAKAINTIADSFNDDGGEKQ